MDNLINELQHIQTEFKVGESTFVSLLITQFSSESKNQIRSIISTSGNFGNVPLEQLLETTRALFYDIDLERFHAQSTNLERNNGESPLAFFSRISAISKLASFYLENDVDRDFRLSSYLNSQS